MSLVTGSDRPSRPGVKLTYDDFVLFPDDGKRHEIIDGEHYVTPSPNTRHQQVSVNLVLLIGGWLETHPLGRLFHAPYDVVLSDMAPRTTGNRLGDQTRSFELFMRALAVAEKLAKPGGAFVGKIFMGEDVPLAKKGVKRVFDEERALRPEGVRTNSVELFLVGLGKKTVIPPAA